MGESVQLWVACAPPIVRHWRTSLTNTVSVTASLSSRISLTCSALKGLREQREMLALYELTSLHLWLFTLEINLFSLNKRLRGILCVSYTLPVFFCCYRGIIGRRFQAKARFLQELLEKVATLLSGTPIVTSSTLPTIGWNYCNWAVHRMVKLDMYVSGKMPLQVNRVS
jgi:hypothetical protein